MEDGAPLRRFAGVLVYGPSVAARVGWFLVALGMGGVGASIVVRVLSIVSAGLAPWVVDSLAWLGFAGGFALSLGAARAGLVLGRDRVAIPRLVGRRTMAYEDVASYALEPASRSLGRHGTIKGQSLTIRSRRADAAPFVVFIPAKRPMDAALLVRLDRVIQSHDAVAARAMA